MAEKHNEARTGCPLRICETVKKVSPDTKRRGFIRGQIETTRACPLCAAKIKGTIEQQGKLALPNTNF